MTDFGLTEEEEHRIRRRIEREEVRNVTWLGIVLIAVGGVGAWSARWDTMTFERYALTAPDRIAVQIECNAASRAKLWEFGDRVEIRIDQRPPSNDQDCASYHCIVLDAALGDRTVVDERSGREAIGYEESTLC